MPAALLAYGNDLGKIWLWHVEEADATFQGGYREDAVDTSRAAACAGNWSLQGCGLFQILSFPMLSCAFSAHLSGDARLGGAGCVSLAPEAVCYGAGCYGGHSLQR